MKKSKLSVGLVTAFIGALALSACNESTPAVTRKDGTIIDFVGYNEKEDRIEINTDNEYSEILDSNEGTKLYYDAILETLIRSQYEKLSKEPVDPEHPDVKLKSFALVKSEANDKIKSAKQTATQNASSSGTTYDEEWKKILDSHDCETEEDLRQYYLYDIEKTELTDWFSKKNIDSLKDEYIGVNAEWKPVEQSAKVDNVDSVMPYHILHILVTLSADKSDYIRGEITQAEAKNLWDVVRKLIDGQYSFQEIAMNKSDDTGSRDKYGDVEIMSTNTSFYNEFKLGVYAYDALLSGVNAFTSGTAVGANAEIYNAFGIKNLDGTSKQIVVKTMQEGETKEDIVDLIQSEMVDNVKTPISSSFTNIPTIPYEIFMRIGEAAEKETLGDTTVAPEAGSVSYPRNVLFNQYLNFHSPFIITDEDLTTSGDDFGGLAEHDFTTGSSNGLKLKYTNFSDTAIPGLTGKKVLTDKDNNVIIGVRSEAGIHFMVMRKSVFYNTNVQVGRNGTSLQDYYTTYIPSEEEYPEGDPQTFVNMASVSDKSYYTKRVDTIKNELKSTQFDAGFDYRLYEFLEEYVGDKLVFPEGSNIKTNIEEYIKLLRETKHNGDIDSINESWKSYLMMLSYQNEVREFEGAMIPTTCVFKFDKKENEELFKEGGICYVKK